MTEIKVRYWDHLGELFGWATDVDHQPCPLASTYQLARAMRPLIGRPLGFLWWMSETKPFLASHASFFFDR